MSKHARSKPHGAAEARSELAMIHGGTMKYYVAGSIEPEADHLTALTKRGVSREDAEHLIQHAKICQSFPIVFVPLAGGNHALVLAPRGADGPLYSWSAAISPEFLTDAHDAAWGLAGELSKKDPQKTFAVFSFTPSATLGGRPQ